MGLKVPPSFYGQADRGLVRDKNEDAWLGPPPLTPEVADAKGYLYIVADGVGGRNAGEFASKLATSIIQQFYYSDSNTEIATSLKAAIQEANRQIYHWAISEPSLFGMCTTVTAAVIKGDELIVANVGDSRAYLVRGAHAYQITVDHTWVEEQRQKGFLTDQEAATHPKRNIITRSLGEKLNVEIDLFRERLVPGDAVVLCTDGLSDLVAPEELAHIVINSGEPEGAVRQLIDLAKERGAPDNVTAVVIKIEQGRKKPPGAAHYGRRNFLVLLLILSILSGLGGVAFLLPRRISFNSSIFASTSTPISTLTPTFTSVPSPTLTKVPTATFTPLPSPTPTRVPTPTPTPTYTPVPTPTSELNPTPQPAPIYLPTPTPIHEKTTQDW